MLLHITALLYISLCTAYESEIHCSRYHYEEQILAKVIKLEHRLDQLENSLGQKCKLSSSDSATAHCPDTWISFDGSCYLFSEGKRTFTEAALHCLVQNAHLVHIGNEKENSFIKSQLLKMKGGHYWIGLTDIDRESTFKWYGTDKDASFTDWSGSGPDNSGGKEHCVHFNFEDFKWNDVSCESAFKCICEKND